MAGELPKVTAKSKSGALNGIFDENAAVLDEILLILEDMRAKTKGGALSPEGKRLLVTARRLLENNKRIVQLIDKLERIW